MFTGIVEELGTVVRLDRRGADAAARGGRPDRRGRRRGPGDSIAVDGVCLTVVELSGDTFGVDVMPETLRPHGARRPGGRLAGQPGARRTRRRSARRTPGPGARRRRGHAAVPHPGRALGRPAFDCPPALARYVAEKGSIAVSGVSLTVTWVEDGRVRGVAHPHDARRDHARAPGTRGPGQPRGRRDRQVRRAPGHHRRGDLAGCRMSAAPVTELGTVEQALDALRAGLPVLVADSADRENEVDVVLAAGTATPEWVAWVVRRSSGYLCAPMPATRADALHLPLMVPRSEDPRRTAYTVTVDAAARRHDRHLGGGPRPDAEGSGRPGGRPGRRDPPRARAAAACRTRRRPAPRRAHRGRRGPVPAGRARSGGRHRRAGARRRDHGPPDRRGRPGRGGGPGDPHDHRPRGVAPRARRRPRAGAAGRADRTRAPHRYRDPADRGRHCS